MKQKSEVIAKTFDEKITVWFELDAEAEIDCDGQENVEKWLSDQVEECSKFENEHPEFEPAGGNGNAVSYIATAKDFLCAGFDVAIEE